MSSAMPKRKKGGKPDAAAVILVAVIVALVVLYLKERDTASPVGRVIDEPAPETGTTLKIASWNLQRFGKDKAGNDSLMAYYVDVLEDYDIIILQEITDSSGEAFTKLCSLMAGYNCEASERLGNSSYKEQYGLIYRNAKLVSAEKGGAGYVRSPYTYHFSAGNWSFYLTTIHTYPDNVEYELSLLEKEIGSLPGDRIVMGDLNADCSYYKTPPADFAGWRWIVPDSEDTTVKSSSCAYDRIIINNDAANNFLRFGVMRDVSPGQSDHYMVYGEYNTVAA